MFTVNTVSSPRRRDTCRHRTSVAPLAQAHCRPPTPPCCPSPLGAVTRAGTVRRVVMTSSVAALASSSRDNPAGWFGEGDWNKRVGGGHAWVCLGRVTGCLQLGLRGGGGGLQGWGTGVGVKVPDTRTHRGRGPAGREQLGKGQRLRLVLGTGLEPQGWEGGAWVRGEVVRGQPRGLVRKVGLEINKLRVMGVMREW